MKQYALKAEPDLAVDRKNNECLQRLDLLSPLPEGQPGVPHYAAVLCFCPAPDCFCPDAVAIFVVGDIGAKTVSDRREVRGPLFEQFRQLRDSTVQNLHTPITFGERAERSETREIPDASCEN